MSLQTRREAPADTPAAGPSRTQNPSPRWSPRIGRFVRWETLLTLIVAALAVVGASLSPFFLTPENFANLTVSVVEIAIMAIPMALVIVAGEIDLSVESMVGLSSSVLGYLWAAGVPLEVAIPLVLAMGALGGLLNGTLVARAGLPSLVVTLGTLALFRGLALVVLGPRGVSSFPDAFTSFGFGTIPGTPIPWPLTVFIALALILGVVLHGTWIGRQIYAVGKSQSAARYSGVRVARVKTALFVLSGAIAALAGIVLTARFATARADAGQGMTLIVVTTVLLGGVNIFGGSGTIPGVALAVVTLAVLQSALRLASVSTEFQSIALGLLLILSVALPYVAIRAGQFVDRVRGGAARGPDQSRSSSPK
jgi:rhamnose transport system permease protein